MNATKLILTATALAAFSVYFALGPIHLPVPRIHGAHDELKNAKLMKLGGSAVGPESIAFDPNGEGPYTGVGDGRILKWKGEEEGWIQFAVTSPQYRTEECVGQYSAEMEHVCGRPLGLRFHQKTGELFIADAYFGLLTVGPNGGLATQIVTEAEDMPFCFTNDLDIDEEEDVIYFTDSSTKFHRRQFMSALLTGDNTGRLIKYNKSSKEVKVLLRGLAFANGVAISMDRSFLLVAETTNCRILRFWLRGPNAGTWDIFAQLPGFPDNIRMNSKGEFWVALHSKKGTISNWAISNPWLGKLLLKSPLSFKQLHSLSVGGRAHATAIRLDEGGQIVQVLEDCQGRTLRFISEVEEKNGKLWIGSVMMPFIGQFKLY